jgi:hypothetical protein
MTTNSLCRMISPGKAIGQRLLKLAGCLIIFGIMPHVLFGSSFDKQNPMAVKFARRLTSLQQTAMDQYGRNRHAVEGPCGEYRREDLSDEQVVQALSSPNWWEADHAVLEIMCRSERMINPLLKNKGNTTPFSGYRLGMENPDKPFPPLPGKAAKLDAKAENANPTGVNVEVASLFLINAIYYDNNIGFAAYPHLLYTPQAELWERLWRTKEDFPDTPIHLSELLKIMTPIKGATSSLKGRLGSTHQAKCGKPGRQLKNG